MLERHQAHYGTMPRQLAADGGYATAANLQDAKDAGVEDVAFHKKRGLIRRIFNVVENTQEDELKAFPPI